MRLRLVGDEREFEVELVSRDGVSMVARIDGREVGAAAEPMPDGSISVFAGGRRIRMFGARRGKSILIAAGPETFEFSSIEGRAARRAHGLAAPEVTAPMPGKVLRVLVAEGDRVEAGQALVVIEAMKMETALAAETPAVVRKIRVVEGAMVDHGAVLIELSPVPDSSPPGSGPPDP